MQEKRGIGYFYFQERYEYEYLHLDALNQIDGKPLLFRISIPPTPPPPPEIQRTPGSCSRINSLGGSPEFRGFDGWNSF